MKYLLICCHEEKQVEAMPKGECGAVMEETIAYCEALKKSGHLIDRRLATGPESQAGRAPRTG